MLALTRKRQQTIWIGAYDGLVIEVVDITPAGVDVKVRQGARKALIGQVLLRWEEPEPLDAASEIVLCAHETDPLHRVCGIGIDAPRHIDIHRDDARRVPAGEGAA